MKINAYEQCIFAVVIVVITCLIGYFISCSGDLFIGGIVSLGGIGFGILLIYLASKKE
nr:hypothetical protein [uncultured Methanoregula sp.]